MLPELRHLLVDLETAIGEVMLRHPQDASRLAPIADYAISQLDQNGLPGAKGGSSGELPIAGLSRTKDWDVAYDFAGKPRLLLSLKSIWKNASGTVPNRIDDLMGETANVQQMSPEVVVGYILLFDIQADSKRRDQEMYWSDFFEQSVKRIAIRRAPLWNQGLIEGTWFIKFDSSAAAGRRIVDPPRVAEEGNNFFRALLRELKLREPAIPFTRAIP